MTCPEPIRESDELVCRDCRLRWDANEEKPGCPKPFPPKKNKEPTVSVTLNREDFWFILGSINENVPSSNDMSPAERRTYRKLQDAEDRLANKRKQT